MKKIGLVTCYVNNYGACLQAYALEKTLTKFNYQVEIIKYTPVYEVKEKAFIRRILFWLRQIYRCIKYKKYSYHFKTIKHFDKFRKKYLVFSNENYSNESELYNFLKYDAYVTGSDQLWNPTIHNNAHNKIYFLDFVKEGKIKIAYAPSIGIPKFPSEELEKEAVKMLSSFDFLSCREKTGADYIQTITGKSCLNVLDPTLLISKEEWQTFCGPRIIKKNYVFIYRFGETPEEEKMLSEIVKNTDKDIYCLPMSLNDFSKKYKTVKPCGPAEFVNYIRYADCVITDSFHATAFSINLNTPFFCLLRCLDTDKNNMNSRITDILAKFNLNDRLVFSNTNIKNILSKPIDFSISNTLLNNFRTNDIELLKGSFKR